MPDCQYTLAEAVVLSDLFAFNEGHFCTVLLSQSCLEIAEKLQPKLLCSSRLVGCQESTFWSHHPILKHKVQLTFSVATRPALWQTSSLLSKQQDARKNLRHEPKVVFSHCLSDNQGSEKPGFLKSPTLWVLRFYWVFDFFIWTSSWEACWLI